MTDRALTVVTKESDGRYRATRGGRSVTVRPGQVLGNEAIDAKRARLDALQAFRGEATDDTEQAALKAEERAALVAWKVDAYEESVKRRYGNAKRLAAKLAYWQGEAKRMAGRDTRS